MNCELTIVIPVRNRVRLVVNTLASIGAQTTRQFRVILVDNASTDDTLEVLKRWEADTDLDVTVLQASKLGASCARNRGLKEVTTPWVMFFDSDDTMPSDNIANLLDTIKAHPQADIVTIERRFYNADGRLLRCDRPYAGDALFHCLFHGGMATAAFIARTQLLRDAGGWNENLSTWDDIDLGLRMQMKKPRIAASKGARCDILVHGDSISGTDFSARARQIEATMRAMERTLQSNSRSTQPIDVLRGIVAGRYYVEGAKKDAQRLRKTLTSVTDRLAYHMSASGMRGVARLLRPFLRLD